jgi:hypothetical protein
MQQNQNKERLVASLIGRILSMEALLLLMGVASLVYGIINNAETSILWGVIIIPGVFVLMKVRRKDWKKHWEEMEAEKKSREDYVRWKNSTASGRKK